MYPQKCIRYFLAILLAIFLMAIALPYSLSASPD